MVPPLVDHLKYSFADQTSVLLAVLVELAHAVKEITALHELHDEVEALVLLEEVDERYDVRMVERGHDGDLLVGVGLLLVRCLFSEEDACSAKKKKKKKCDSENDLSFAVASFSLTYVRTYLWRTCACVL